MCDDYCASNIIFYTAFSICLIAQCYWTLQFYKHRKLPLMRKRHWKISLVEQILCILITIVRIVTQNDRYGKQPPSKITVKNTKKINSFFIFLNTNFDTVPPNI